MALYGVSEASSSAATRIFPLQRSEDKDEAASASTARLASIELPRRSALSHNVSSLVSIRSTWRCLNSRSSVSLTKATHLHSAAKKPCVLSQVCMREQLQIDSKWL